MFWNLGSFRISKLDRIFYDIPIYAKDTLVRMKYIT